jgi:basic membrane lipoprotein Med (substrate-binding protein (PBP1-ABC) superfamily)
MRQDRRPTRVRQRITNALVRYGRLVRGLRGGQRAVALATAGILAAGVALWIALAPAGQKPRARQYLSFKACLLTDAQGVAGKEAAPVWAGMEKASLKTRAKVQYLPAFGPATTANTQPYLRSLTQERCNVIVAVGAGPVAAAAAEAPENPKINFVIVAGNATGHNVTALNASSDQISAAVSNAIARQVHTD